MMLAQWLVIAFVIVVVFIVMKVANKKQEAAVKLTLIMFVFLMISAGYVYITSDVDITSADGIILALKVYWVWVVSVANNIIDVSAYVIHQDWGLNSSMVGSNSSG